MADFWLMVYHKKVSTIVMLSDCNEGDTVKYNAHIVTCNVVLTYRIRTALGAYTLWEMHMFS